jgi:hypothetical protein
VSASAAQVIAAALADGSCHVGSGAGRVDYPHCFNIVTLSELLAQFAGVLTGLTFAALALLAERFAGGGGDALRRRRRSIDDTLVLFCAAFVSFAIATYLFSSAAGEMRPQGRASFLAFCASLALSVALQQLFVGLVRLVDHLGFDQAARFTAGVYSHGVLPVVFVYMSVTAVDSAGLYKSESEAWSTPLAYGCLLLIVLLVARTLQPTGNTHGRERASVMLPTVVSVLLTVVAAITAAVWAEQLYTAAAPDGVYLAFVTLLFLVTVLFHARVRGYFSLTRLVLDDARSRWTRRRRRVHRQRSP